MLRFLKLSCSTISQQDCIHPVNARFQLVDRTCLCMQFKDFFKVFSLCVGKLELGISVVSGSDA